MSLTKLTENLNKVSSLPDRPTLQSDELKAIFDEAGNSIKDYINEILIEELEKLFSDTSKENKTTLELANTLKTKLDGIDNGATKTAINNTLTSTSTSEALSANQGKSLKDLIDSLTTTVNGKQKTISKGTAIPYGGSDGDIYIQYF